MDRRQFLIRSAALAAGTALPDLAFAAPVPAGFAQDPAVRALAMRALDAAKLAGARYADVRISRNRNQSVSTRERQITGLEDTETYGFGVRVLADGAWGFSASRDLTAAEVERVARLAVAQARANSATMARPVVLAPTQAYGDVTWRSPIRIDPFEVPIEDKVALLLAANEAALGVRGTRYVTSSMFFVREEKAFASTEGTFATQTVYRSYPQMNVTAVATNGGDFQSRASTPVQPMGLGYEHVRDARLVENAPIWAEDAVKKLSARPVQPGR